MTTPLTPNMVCLDCRIRATGVHAAGTTTWTTGCPCYADRAVVLATGEIIAITKTSDTTFTASGNYAGDSVLGCIPTFSVTLTEPITKDNDGNVLADQAIIGTMTLMHESLTGYTVSVSHENGSLQPTEAHSWSPSLITTPSHAYGKLQFTVGARAEECAIAIAESTYKPVRIVGIEYELSLQEGLR